MTRIVAGACVMATAVCLAPARAEACGGTFCDAGQASPMPVDQTGENVIFVMGGELAEIHIQISIDPDTNAENFAWMIPLGAVPEFSVGSQPLFDQVRAATVPLFGLNTTAAGCFQTPTSGGGNEGYSATTPSWSEGGEEPDPIEPDVLLHETVGAFDVVVLQDTQLAPIQMWLETNGYQWDPNAGPILQQYLDEGNVIAALKLTRGAELQDIHPITLRYEGLEVCFPLRLTRIAAVEDMDIRVFVLADDRAAPTNYHHVIVNPLKIDWLNQASNYKEVIAQAVDAPMAGGLAFVTEYAGSSSAVARAGLSDASWNEQAFVGLDPALVIATLNQQGLAACTDEFTCAWNHPLIYGLLLEHLPPPQGTEPLQFYPYLGEYADQIDVMKWDGGAGFAAALLDRVIEPGKHALDLLETWPTLTRMYTTISPSEMMTDPIFHTNPDLPNVAQLRQAAQFVLTSGDSVVRLPDDREVYVPGGATWPDIPGDGWFAEEVQTIPLDGAPMPLVDHRAAIDKTLTAWNTANAWPRELPDPCGGGSSDGPGSTSGLSGSNGLDDGGPDCACRGEADARGPWLGLGLLVLMRRRRQRYVGTAGA